MATPIAGIPGLDPLIPDISFISNGNSYHLCFDWNTICAIFQETKQNLWEDPLLPQDPVKLRFILWQALLRENPEISEKEAGALIVSVRSREIYRKLTDALLGSLPESESEGGGENSTDPPSA